MKKCFTTEQWVECAKKVHSNKYDYSKVNYIDSRHKVCIICPEHGEFWQEPTKHTTGKKSGCPQCAINNFKDTTESFINKAKNVHGDKYDYSKVEYINSQTKVCIICPEHGEFWQTPHHHILGFKCGCPQCSMSKLEGFVIKTLNEKNIEFIHECSKKDLYWLGRQRLDIFIPKMNLCIECQGIQHFKPEYFGGKMDKKENLEKNIKNDIKKFEKCVENNVKVIYVVDNKEDVINNVIYKYNNVYDKDEFIKLFENEA